MATPYSDVLSSFIFKVTEHKLLRLAEYERDEILIRYMKAACGDFNRLCKNTCGIDLEKRDEESEEFQHILTDEIIDILSEGMIVQWLKPYAYSSDNLENTFNTKDISQYSPANLLREIGSAYQMSKKDYKQQKINFSFNNAGGNSQ